MAATTNKLLLLMLAFLAVCSNGLSQPCSDTAYKIRYSSTDSVYAFNHIATNDYGTLIIGETRNYPSKSGLIIKLDAFGDVVWSRKLQGPSKINLNKIISLKDGSYIVAGTALHWNPVSHNMYVTKVDANGNLVWQRFYKLDNHSNHNPVFVFQISEGLDGDVLLCWQRTQINFGVNDERNSSLLMRLDKNGSVVWSRNMGVLGQTNIAGIFIDAGNIIALGQVSSPDLSCPGTQAGAFFIMQLDYNSGIVQQQKSYCYKEIDGNEHMTQSNDHHFSAVQLNDGKYALFGTFFLRVGNNYHYKVVFDKQFDLFESRLYTTPYHETMSMIHVLPSGETAITTLHPNPKKAVYGFVDNNGRLMSQKSVDFDTDVVPLDNYYNFTYHNADWTYRKRGSNKVSIVHNLTTGADRYIELSMMPMSGTTLSCFGADTSVMSVLPFQTTPTTFSWNINEANRVIADPGHYTLSVYNVQKHVVCKLDAACNQVRIMGKDTVCSTGQPVAFIARKDDCNKPVQWTYPNEWIASGEAVNDTILRLVFKQPVSSPQQISLHVTLGDCMIADSLLITLLPSARSLPPDTVICGMTNIMLHAGSGMKSYLWQDGSTDSLYHVRSKGLYAVTMEDYCGNRHSDTMQIADPFVYLGKDTSICTGEFMELRATAGFARYNWTATNYVRLSENAIRFSPATTANYIVTATTSDGCETKDTININIYPAVSNFIFSDTTICSYEDLTLKPTSAFVSYLWNDGSTGSSLFTNKAGDYWLQVTNQNGCKGRQDIKVRTKPCDTYVRFPSAFTPNQDNRNDVFKPIIAGRFAAYRFEVFNRWGQKVFASTDPKKGWDGKVNGNTQDAGIFVWRCAYQLQGEGLVVRKGTVMVVR